MSDECDDRDGCEPELLTQPGLVSAILQSLERFGIEQVSHRQVNAVIAGANVIYDALSRDDVAAVENMGLTAWLASDDTGLSSRYLATAISGRECREFHHRQHVHHPWDADDFGRCYRMLKACPEYAGNLCRLAEPAHGRAWNGLYAAWAELTDLWVAKRHSDLTRRISMIVDIKPC